MCDKPMQRGGRWRGRAGPLLALVWAASLFAGCAAPRAGSGYPVIQTLRPHAEPELVEATHTVEAGQTLYRIARTYEVTVEALMAANQISDPRTLAVGQRLVIPGAPGAKPIVPPGAQEAPEVALAQAAGTPDAPPGSAAATAKDPKPRKKKQEAVVMPKGSGVLQWPLRGVLYARFGRKGNERHDGIDLAAPAGTPVRTAGPGTVLYAGEQKGYGLIAIVDHGNELITLYAHNRDLRVRTGQKVREGQVIATVGESGRTSGPHLHFEVRQGGLPVDPLKLLGAPPQSPRGMGRRSRQESR